MNTTDLAIVFGVMVGALGLLKFFGAVTSRQPLGWALLMLLLGGGALVFVHLSTTSGLVAADIPAAFSRLFAFVFL